MSLSIPSSIIEIILKFFSESNAGDVDAISIVYKKKVIKVAAYETYEIYI